MDFKNKTFKDNKTGEEVKVVDIFENIAILVNKDGKNEKIDTRRLMNPLYYSEQIDPKNFFNNQSTYNSLAEKIKNIPLDSIRDDDGGTVVRVPVNDNNPMKPSIDDVAVVMSSEDEERAELARKYGVQVDNSESLNRQNEAFARILGDDADELPNPVPIIQRPVSQNQVDIQRIEVNRDGNQQIINEPQTIVVDDPIISLFKKTKRTVDFSISIDIDNKIPRLDFIEMMEESYEMSIIDFLAEEFTENLLKNPRIIRNMIREKIKEMVYKKETKKVKKVTSEKPTPTIIKEENPNKKVKKVPPPPPPPPSRLLKEGQEPPKPNK